MRGCDAQPTAKSSRKIGMNLWMMPNMILIDQLVWVRFEKAPYSMPPSVSAVICA